VSFPLDYLDGHFDFNTELENKDGKWIASAFEGKYTASHPDQSQALNDLNQKLSDAMERGDLIPNGTF
jgi:hypothetical protein